MSRTLGADSEEQDSDDLAAEERAAEEEDWLLSHQRSLANPLASHRLSSPTPPAAAAGGGGDSGVGARGRGGGGSATGGGAGGGAGRGGSKEIGRISTLSDASRNLAQFDASVGLDKTAPGDGQQGQGTAPLSPLPLDAGGWEAEVLLVNTGAAGVGGRRRGRGRGGSDEDWKLFLGPLANGNAF